MIRVKISGFIRRNKYKIQDLLTKLIIVAIVVLIATIMLSLLRSTTKKEEKTTKESYIPTETVIKGDNISKEQYSVDTNIVNKFLEYCNNKKIEEAYSLLSEECKKELYPTVEHFKTNYCDFIFNIGRQYNLQSWISTSKYTVYKIRYTNSMLSTGKYNENDVYQDYITLNKNSEKETISIGNLVYVEGCNIVTKTDELEATVVKKKIYVSNEEYEIKIKNNTHKRILLDNRNKADTINLVSNRGNKYACSLNEIFYMDLMLEPGETKKIKISFNKNLSSDRKSKVIEFVNIIKDYDMYVKEMENYNDIIRIKINVED